MNQPSYVVTFDQQLAERAGGASFDGGAHVGTIIEAKFVTARSGTKGVELTFESESGQKFNYLSMYYQKSDGQPVKSGMNCLNAIMFFLKISGITARQSGQDYLCPELIGKRVGLFLQKRLYTKNDGSDGFDFSIRAPFHPDTKQTVKECTGNIPALSVEKWVESYSDNDERKQSVGGVAPANQFPDDDIPGW